MAKQTAAVVLSSSVLVGACLLVPSVAQAGLPQGQVPNPPPELMPGPTNTVHEIGATMNFTRGTFDPQFNWRMQFPKTGAQGQLSGLWLGVDIGPAIGYRGGASGMVGFRIGYEFDPWSNLGLTFSPVVHFDNYFGNSYYWFQNTFGGIARLYINQHWVVQFEPFSPGFAIVGAGGNAFAGFNFRAGWGFAYKF